MSASAISAVAAAAAAAADDDEEEEQEEEQEDWAFIQWYLSWETSQNAVQNGFELKLVSQKRYIKHTFIESYFVKHSRSK